MCLLRCELGVIRSEVFPGHLINRRLCSRGSQMCNRRLCSTLHSSTTWPNFVNDYISSYCCLRLVWNIELMIIYRKYRSSNTASSSCFHSTPPTPSPALLYEVGYINTRVQRPHDCPYASGPESHFSSTHACAHCSCIALLGSSRRRGYDKDLTDLLLRSSLPTSSVIGAAGTSDEKVEAQATSSCMRDQRRRLGASTSTCRRSASMRG